MTTTEAPALAGLTAEELAGVLKEKAEEFKVPGAAVGILLDGEEIIATYGVTSVENPLDVTDSTLFQFGSTGKTYTATAIMILAEQGKLDLNAPVRTYVPELKLKDEETAKNVTVLQLLNHSAGWQGDFFEDTGRGDDAIEKFVEKMADLEQVTPLGTQASYNNAALVLAGRVIEKVTGQTYEKAIKELVLDPLGLEKTSSDASVIMTGRFVVGHIVKDDGTTTVVPSWSMPRAITPAGGWSSDIKEQLAWAKFHLGDGKGKDGQQVLSKAALDKMKEPTFSLGGGAIGDYVGTSWLIRDIEGVRLVGHGGTTNGQLSAFQTVPEKNFAVAVLTNANVGGQLHGAMVKWALERCLGVKEPEAEQLTLTPDQLQEFTGRFENIHSFLNIAIADGRLEVKSEVKPELIEKARKEAPNQEALDKIEEQLKAATEQPAIPIAILADDKFVVADGQAKGMKGFFVRSDAGEVFGINFGGRLSTRVAV